MAVGCSHALAAPILLKKRFPARPAGDRRSVHAHAFSDDLVIIALVVVVLFASLSGGNSPTRGAQELPYSQLMGMVEKGEINSVTTQGDMLFSAKGGQTYVTYLPNGTMANVVERLDQAKVAVDTRRPKQGPGVGDILLGILPMLLLIGAWFFFMRQMQGGGRGAMGFGRSKARLLTEAKGRSFEDVAGIDEAKEELGEIVEFERPGKFQRLGGKIPKGALLVGPPGTVKRCWRARIAGEANVPFFSISGSDFVEMFVGVGASRVRDMFESKPRRTRRASSSSMKSTRWAAIVARASAAATMSANRRSTNCSSKWTALKPMKASS